MNKLVIRTKDDPKNGFIVKTDLTKIDILRELNNQNKFIELEGVYINKDNISSIALAEY